MPLPEGWTRLAWLLEVRRFQLYSRGWFAGFIVVPAPVYFGPFAFYGKTIKTLPNWRKRS